MASPLTAEGTIVGTFQYMAPEQIEGSQADARSDIFSFGTVLYEMATAQKAFEGKTQASLIGSIMKEEPRPIATLAPMTPPGLNRLVKTCLAKDPDERRQTMHDVLLELRWIAEAGSQAGVPLPVASRRQLLGWIGRCRAGRQLDDPRAAFRRGAVVEIACREPQRVQVDGDPLPGDEAGAVSTLRVKVLPGALPVLWSE